MSRAIVAMAEEGIEAEAAARARLANVYKEFLDDPARKNDAGRDLIQVIFGKEAIAEDPLR